MIVSTYAQAAAELAAIAGANAMRYYRTALDAETKNDGSPVTIADKSSERLVREWIERRFPSDGILGEEFGAHNVGARRRWIVDPIDGTKAFIHGVPFWGSLVAGVEGETVIAGAASFPALGETLVAAQGKGLVEQADVGFAMSYFRGRPTPHGADEIKQRWLPADW